MLGAKKNFLGKMRKDWRLVIPKLTTASLKRDEPSLEACALEVKLELGLFVIIAQSYQLTDYAHEVTARSQLAH